MHPMRDDENRYVTGTKMKLFKVVSFIVVSFLSTQAFSWDSSVVGKIKKIDVASAENYGFRVTLKGSSSNEVLTQCGVHSWSYLNKSSSNYEVFVSVLLAAKLSQTPVVIYTNRETGSGNGYCHIGYIGLSDQ
jgi:hypothetical protein